MKNGPRNPVIVERNGLTWRGQCAAVLLPLLVGLAVLAWFRYQ